MLLAVVAGIALALSTPAWAQEKTAVRDGFTFEAAKPVRILVFRPSIRVGEQSTGGMFEPRADWTDQARGLIEQALTARQASFRRSIVEAPEVAGEQARMVRDYQALFGAVAESVINYQFFKGNRLETKKRDNREGVFQWSLGPGVADLPGARDADYALFINTEDHYGSTGRKVLQIFAAAAGVGVTSGKHAGYAGLIDLKTGDLLWINADNAMGGDVREADGAVKRVGQLLEEFPLDPASAAK
jgi:hypothetical protein